MNQVQPGFGFHGESHCTSSHQQHSGRLQGWDILCAHIFMSLFLTYRELSTWDVIAVLFSCLFPSLNLVRMGRLMAHLLAPLAPLMWDASVFWLIACAA